MNFLVFLGGGWSRDPNNEYEQENGMKTMAIKHSQIIPENPEYSSLPNIDEIGNGKTNNGRVLRQDEQNNI